MIERAHRELPRLARNPMLQSSGVQDSRQSIVRALNELPTQQAKMSDGIHTHERRAYARLARVDKRLLNAHGLRTRQDVHG
jgi:hypothetical protein